MPSTNQTRPQADQPATSAPPADAPPDVPEPSPDEWERARRRVLQALVRWLRASGA